MATKKESEAKQKRNQPEEKDHQESNSKAIAGDAQAESNLTQDVDELTQSLDSDLGEMEPENGLELVNQWYNLLHKSNEPGVKELGDGLKDLQKLLKSGKGTGHDISELLIHLSEQTQEFASNAEKDVKQPVQRLAKQLRKAGTSIAKTEDQEYHQQIDSLLETMEEDELTSMDADQGVGAIDFWLNLLNKAEGESFQQLANSLKELKQALKRGNSKTETIARALSQVGEQATQVASETPRGFKGAIQKLGKHLSSAGNSLTAAE